MPPVDYEIMHTGKEKAELRSRPRDARPLAANEIAGRTLVSAISPGTEVVGCYCATHYQLTDSDAPRSTGYAAVFEVEEVGSDVAGIKVGDVVYGSLPHKSRQRVPAARVVRLPDGLMPEKAVFCRFPKIAMPTFVHTRVRPPEVVVVTGLGLVGLMAAQVAQVCGYEVVAVDPDDRRRAIAQAHGVRRVLLAPPLDDPAMAKRVGLGVDCSGHEQAVLDLCNLVRVRGEVFLIGVPWVPRTTLLAQGILHSVFYNYVTLTSGWEGQMPASPETHSDLHHIATALGWIADGRIRIHESLYARAKPDDPQTVYQNLLHRRTTGLTVVFDWRNANNG
ncbi:MAG: hypothetical protein A3K19_26215 [Lentisphaerae bacterium RIFOXYB12_FULL_65_16]|nr:MAG: hypothetical protein A3K18_29680 [Lentisphaerae bacterium RIFOXYA12_64_32]OGV87770.1 MAG: hypothetical protein A3K19_26215 [Lentisphaerae bacterium RIFOXYB12_FULL_65_16]